MISDRTLMNDLARGSSQLYELSPEENARLKRILLGMYAELAALCRENGLTLLMAGGSALGAVRHKGFIPWDDDLDLMMPRKDYDALVRLLREGALGEKYEFTLPSKDADTRNLFLKIFLRGSVFSEVIDAAMPFPKGVFLDVFPIENCPGPSLLSRIRGYVIDAVKLESVCVLFYQYRSEEYRMYMKQNPVAWKRYRMRLLLGFLGSFMSHRRWACLFDRMAQYDKETGYMTIPSGTKRYWGEMHPTESWLPASKGEFEGMEVELPHVVDDYLRGMYGNYMEIPPVEKRERHFVYKVELPE